MSVTAIAPKWETSDGEGFGTEKEAAAHQEILDAREAHKDATARLGRLLAESLITADGKRFDFSAWEYWHVTRAWNYPVLREVKFYSWNCAYEGFDGDFCIIYPTSGERTPQYRVSELYANKANAEKALVLARDEWLAEKTAENAQDRARLFPAEETPDA